MNGELDVTPSITTSEDALAEFDLIAEQRALVADLRAGDLIANKYVFDRVLGSGGMGLVLSATHVDLKRLVAIKLVRSEFLQNEEIVARLLAEAQMAASIRSEHAARVLDMGRLQSGAPYIVFEYLEGRDLSAFLSERGPLPAAVAVQFVLQVCDALAEAHSAGIVHRDLKPENIFLTRQTDGTPIVKVLDFGISKKLSARDPRAVLTGPFQAIGSPYYMAPEQMRTGHEVDARADIWALGVVLYELCTGKTPFHAESVPAVCARVLDDTPAPPRSFVATLPKGLERVIMRCLRKDPKRRYQDVAELAAALVHFGPEQAKAYAARISRVVVGRSGKLANMSGVELKAGATQRSVGIADPQIDFIPISDVGPMGGPMTPLSLVATIRTRKKSWATFFRPAMIVAGCACVAMLASAAFFEFVDASRPLAVETRTPAKAPVATAPAEVAIEAPVAAKPDGLDEFEPAPEPPPELPAPPAVLRPSSCARAKAKPAHDPPAEPTASAAPLASSLPDPWNPRNFGGRQ